MTEWFDSIKRRFGPFHAFLPDHWHLTAEARYKFAVEIARVMTQRLRLARQLIVGKTHT